MLLGSAAEGAYFRKSIMAIAARTASSMFVLSLVLACAEGAGTDGASTSYSSGEDDLGDSSTDDVGDTVSETGAAFCGDQSCDMPGETCQSCPADCGACAFCGDQICAAAAGETCGTCPQDCDVCPGCGNGTCEPSESCETCPVDCTEGCGDPICGDMFCNGSETCQLCPVDCGMCADFCGDSACNGGEDCGSCPQDCGACASCPNGQCGEGESCQSCPDDCGECTCPCNPGDPNFNNFCYWPPNTGGCPMTMGGGYCDPNGDGSYQDGDWNQGWYDYQAQCG